jgi:hypothetical protein
VSVVVSVAVVTMSVLVWRKEFFLSHGCLFLTSQLGIADRLCQPSEAMMEVYGPVVVEAIRFAAWFLAATVGSCLVPCIIVWAAREFCVIGLVEMDE